MKKIFLFGCLMLLSIAASATEIKKVAILEVVDKVGNLNYSQKLMLRSNLSKAITQTAGYEAYDRSDIDALISEQDFQRTGMVSDKDIKKLGEMTGASYILVSEGVLTGDGKMFVTAKIVNVETAKVEVTDNATMGLSTSDMQRGCRTLASKMFGSLGAITATTAAIFGGTKAVQNSQVDAARQAQRDAEAQVREQQRLANEQALEQQRLANEKARLDREAAEEAARKQAQEAKMAEQQRLKDLEPYFVRRVSSNSYIYMGNNMDKKGYSDFLSKNCSAAYEQYKKGQKLAGAGWGVFAVGLAAIAGGTTMMILDKNKTKTNGSTTVDTYDDESWKNWEKSHDGQEDYYYTVVDGTTCCYYPSDKTYYYWNEQTGLEGQSPTNPFSSSTSTTNSSSSAVSTNQIIGYTLIGIGGAMTVVSIPILAAGYSKQKKSCETFNNQCAEKKVAPLSLNFKVGPQCLGMALNF